MKDNREILFIVSGTTISISLFQLSNGNSQIPKVLDCGHIFCWNCIFATSIGRDPTVVCPTCNKITKNIYNCNAKYDLCEDIDNLDISLANSSTRELTDFTNIALTVDGISFSMREDIRKLEHLILSQNKKNRPDYESGLAEKQRLILKILKSKAYVMRITVASYLMNHKMSRAMNQACTKGDKPLFETKKDFLSLRRWGIKENKFKYRGGFRTIPMYHMCSSPSQLGHIPNILKQYMIQLKVLRVSSKAVTLCSICNDTVHGGTHGFVEHCVLHKHRGVLVHVVRTDDWCELYLFSKRQTFNAHSFVSRVEFTDDEVVPDFLEEFKSQNDLNESKSPADFFFPRGIHFREGEALFIHIPSVCEVHQPTRGNFAPEDMIKHPCDMEGEFRLDAHEERVFFKKTELIKWFNLYSEESDSIAQLTAVLEGGVSYSKTKRILLWKEVANCINSRIINEQVNLFGGIAKQFM
ncbi:unnamed protein product [Auanema sp. JU1783]|nr:unnamed protein product [Auanema sp. JU1783]